MRSQFFKIAGVIAFPAAISGSAASLPDDREEKPASEVRVDVTKPEDAKVNDERMNDVFQLELLPETTEIAPIQPLYVRIRLTNRLNRPVQIPTAISGGDGLAVFVSENERRHAFLTERMAFGYRKSLNPKEYIDWHAVVCIDFHPPDLRRSPRRVFDLDGNYRLWVAHMPLAKNEDERLFSNSVSITVRKPREDEKIAGEIFSLGNLAPPSHTLGQNGPRDRDIQSELRRFLSKYPNSVFADDCRWFLAKQIELVRYKGETQRERDLATAEFLEQLVLVDPKRTSMRRMIYFAKPPHENHLVFKPSLTEALSNAEVQKLIDVPKILKQLRQAPPYFPEDKDLAESMEKALAQVEATLPTP